MARSFRLELGPERYSFVETGGSDVSTLGTYGVDPAVLHIDGDIFYCWIEDPDEEVSVVLKVDSVTVCKTEMVEVLEDGEEVEDESEEEPGPVLVEDETA
jgi:hypothetical protein